MPAPEGVGEGRRVANSFGYSWIIFCVPTEWWRVIGEAPSRAAWAQTTLPRPSWATSSLPASASSSVRGAENSTHSFAPPVLSPAWLPSLGCSRGQGRRGPWLQSPCDPVGKADDTHQVNLGPPGDERARGGVRCLGGLDQIIHTGHCMRGSAQDTVGLASKGDSDVLGTTSGLGMCDIHSRVCMVLGQCDRQKQHFLVAGLPSHVPPRKEGYEVFISAQSPGPWRHSAGAVTMLSQSLRARAAGKGHRAPISQMWKLRPRGGIREVSVSDATGCRDTEARGAGGLGGSLLPPSFDAPREPGAL